MRLSDFDHLLGLLVVSSPRSVFLEVAFLEAWVGHHRRRQQWIPVSSLAGSLEFLERELRWRPRPTGAPEAAQAPAAGGLFGVRPAWAQQA